jgi:hypothetical protein
VTEKRNFFVALFAPKRVHEKGCWSKPELRECCFETMIETLVL